MAKIKEEQHHEKAVFVGVIKQGDEERQVMEYLDELEFLAETAGAIGVKKFIQIFHNLSFVINLFDDSDKYCLFVMLFCCYFCHVNQKK